MKQPMNENKALVYVAGFFAWGIVSIVQSIKGSSSPLVKFNYTPPPPKPTTES